MSNCQDDPRPIKWECIPADMTNASVFNPLRWFPFAPCGKRTDAQKKWGIRELWNVLRGDYN